MRKSDVEQSKGSVVRAEALRCQRVIIQGKPALKAVFRDAQGLLVAMWREGKTPVVPETGKAYQLSGEIKTVHGQRLLAEPAISVPAEVPAAAKPKAKPSVRLAIPSKLTMPSKRRLAITAAAVFGFFGLVGALGAHDAAPQAAIDVQDSATAAVRSSQGTAKTAETSQKAAIQQAASATPQPPLTPDDCQDKAVPFMTTTRYDPSLPAGQVSYSPQGADGKDKVCYVHGRSQAPETTRVVQPVNEVKLIGTKEAAPAAGSGACDGYVNVDGNCVPSPSADGAAQRGYSPTFKCKDGTYSYAQNSQGACSRHGGIGQRL